MYNSLAVSLYISLLLLLNRFVCDLQISWERVRPYDWTHYTHLVIRTRGDGRSYNIVLSMDRYYDLQWNDQFCYVLFTRGGPYWQTAKVEDLSAKKRRIRETLLEN